MRYSQTLIPTLKETPSEAETISHQLMLRAGFIRKLASGIYTWLPMGLRVLRKIEYIVREEMNLTGSCELLMPGMQPAELWQKSGRWEEYGQDLICFNDRHNHNLCLAPTHEEVITDLISREIRSYRDMPLRLYQIQTKFRDELRPRFGIIRAREFLMKDAYSFDLDETSSSISYKIMYDAYKNILNKLGLRYTVIEADSGTIGGSFSHEFIALSKTGENSVVTCQFCNFAANLEKVTVTFPPQKTATPTMNLKEVFTHKIHNVDEIATFFKISLQKIAKTIIYLADNQPIAVMIRGDRKINEVKLKKITNSTKLILASPTIVEKTTGGPIGYSGPIGLNIPIYADQELILADALVVGANKKFIHIVGFHLIRDLPHAYQVDLRNASQDDPCPLCGSSTSFTRGIEVAHIFNLGTKYSKALNATYLNANGQQKPIIMGCYGIGISRIVAAIIEQNYDKNGIILPISIAPITVIIIPTSIKGQVWDTAQRLYNELWNLGIDSLLDDRNLRLGIKFKDSDLLGITLRVLVSKEKLAQNLIEIKKRINSQIENLPLEIAVEYIREITKKGVI